ncbi:MAG TPA: putative toxin-antitoxin system toxin component, PIN family [Haliscomenobacter sp.]|uniref:putative toxin-antitoxin system toxin component, PIN family n=1 Tax=Haliscomenobacter sp. TaxID=2717303 RepID=UPI002C8BBBC1|nr:putative toxin-antitoxin system toxin component, PIN family [Haliscomenobacter sp.]HOY20184.1 putative toxin-antitoxin system toxin component, PIN family [Haliscomenobacter sp.]
METNRVVIDTNVLISAIIGQFSYPYKIFDELVLAGEVVLCISPQLLKEYEEVVKRDKFKKIKGFAAKASKLIRSIKEIALMVDPQEQIAIIADAPDNRVLEAAVEAKARVIVTGNSRDFTFTEFRGIKIQSPKEFYEEFIKN